MTFKYKTNATSKDIEIIGDSVVAIKDAGLINTFVQSPAHGIAKLAENIALVSPESISVDSHGRIIIEDKNFAAKLQAALSVERAGGDINYVCKNAYQCKEQ